jgi:pyruvate kinase
VITHFHHRHLLALPLFAHVQVARTTKGYMRNVTSTVITSYDNAVAEALQSSVGKGLLAAGDAVVCINGSRDATEGATSVSVITA